MDRPRQVPRLAAADVARFKRDGFIVLPAAADPDLCRQARDALWGSIATALPRLRRGEPRTWRPFTEQEQEELRLGRKPGVFVEGTHRLYVRNGTSQLMLDLCTRALFTVAEQLLGEGDVLYPVGPGADGTAEGLHLRQEPAGVVVSLERLFQS